MGEQLAGFGDPLTTHQMPLPYFERLRCVFAVIRNATKYRQKKVIGGDSPCLRLTKHHLGSTE